MCDTRNPVFVRRGVGRGGSDHIQARGPGAHRRRQWVHRCGYWAFKRDLLVGQFGEGKLRIYLNIGTDTDPKFDKYEFLKAGTADVSVPSG